ncbi:isochorismate synthase DhbC [Paenibacillus sp. SYP-B3998]|uniref:isochorismate synthase n=1 Tax=Paenibacillus sp. SYP-B3998 TaxID=2678564 RepID=A0A6G3ZY94_9BACL|nr:isochorismate synthase DhbC [Paenibacillus sp. SYP-B3998]NEW06377.1 isochorismate synthase DhbC [Paenibacillus sp. SYP-B3998]
MKYDIAPVASATQLLDEYKANSTFFLASPLRTLLAQGTFATLHNQEGNNDLKLLPARVTALLNGAKQADLGVPIVVGAVPFDHTKPAQLVVPKSIQWSGPLHVEPNKAEGIVGAAYAMQAVPEPVDYIRGVEKGLALLEKGDLRKIVLARSLHLTSPTKVDIHQLLRNLARHNTHGYTFAVDLPKQENDDSSLCVDSLVTSCRTLIGASPELLVSRTGLQVVSNPLAGSTPRSNDPLEDQRRAAALLSSPKDLHEHAVVVEAVAAALRPYCKKLDVPSAPSLIHTATMWHLSSQIKGELADPSISSLELAVALHPTPAVCGTPTDLARAAIQEIEPFDRGFYTGMVGWCDSNGDGEWIVTIRCAEVDDRSLRLFAGAGVVLGSSAEGELAETSAKFGTMLLAMGLKPE